MDEKELKTSLKTRIFIIVIAVLMVGSMIAGYAGMVLGGSGDSSSSGNKVDEKKIAELEAAYSEKEAEFSKAVEGDFNEFIKFKSEIRGYNEAAANGGGVSTRDLKVGTGRTLGEGDTDYYAYYVGWCADETIFDSSFNDKDNPTAFSKALDASLGMIEGWNVGVEGMKIDGIREVTISSELAYGESMEICGGYNKPLKFMILVKEKAEPLLSLAKGLDDAYMRLQYAYYGMDYDDMVGE